MRGANVDEPAKTRVCALLVMKLLRCRRVLGQTLVRMFSHFGGYLQLLVFHQGFRAKQVLFNNVESAVHNQMLRCLMSLPHWQAGVVMPGTRCLCWKSAKSFHHDSCTTSDNIYVFIFDLRDFCVNDKDRRWIKRGPYGRLDQDRNLREDVCRYVF